MNNRLLITIFCTCLVFGLHAQVGSTYHRTDTSRSNDIRERLVQLAMQNPEFEIIDRHLNIANYQLNKAKYAWLDVVSGSLNLNEITIAPRKGNQLFFPLWNVSVNIPLNYFAVKKNDIKIAQENVLITAAEKNSRYRVIRASVLSKYEDFLMNKEKLEMQSRVTQDFYLDYKQKEKDFEDNLITNLDYNKAFALYKEQYDKQLEITRNYRVNVLELEQMIGLSLEEVLKRK